MSFIRDTAHTSIIRDVLILKGGILITGKKFKILQLKSGNEIIDIIC